jgi:hypothetical protein
VILGIIAPFSTEPLALAVGGVMPWLLLRIIGTPTMPAALAYLVLWQWMQVFSRVLQAWVDGETLGGGIDGASVARAYWYMLASLLVLTCTLRLVLTGLAPATPSQRTAHFNWQIRDLLLLYIGASLFAVAMGIAARMIPGLAQPLGAAASVKVVAIFVLFVYAMSTGRGTKFMLGVVLFEIGLGFTGFFSNFRGVFIYLAIAAVAARIRWGIGSTVAAVIGAAGLVSLALFWTAVKNDYRVFAAQSDESQMISVPLSERMAYLGERLIRADRIDLGATAYLLLHRLAYVDIFGSVIDVQEAYPEPVPMRQWSEAISHLTMPRFLFPDKAALSDSEVYMRLARRFSVEGEIRVGTSISVGYMAENYADLGFPGMLFGIMAIGLIIGGALRIMMNFKLPLVMREGIAMAFAFTMSHDGVEVSLPKTLGAAVMFFLVFLLLQKFAFPRIVQWLDHRRVAGRPRYS